MSIEQIFWIVLSVVNGLGFIAYAFMLHKNKQIRRLWLNEIEQAQKDRKHFQRQIDMQENAALKDAKFRAAFYENELKCTHYEYHVQVESLRDRLDKFTETVLNLELPKKQ